MDPDQYSSNVSISEIVKRVSLDTELPQEQVQEVIRQALRRIRSAVLAGYSVRTRDFGTFFPKNWAARVVQSHLRGETKTYRVAASTTVGFRPTKRRPLGKD